MLRYINPLQWARWTFEFFFAWTISIPWQFAAKAVPAFLLMVILSIMGFIAYTDGSRWRDSLVDRQFAAAWEADDYATAELVLRRQLKQRGDDDSQLLFRLALARDAQEENEEAIELMRQLVSFRQHAPASRWLLQELYSEVNWPELDSDARSEMGKLLETVHRETPKDLRVKSWYAEYLIATKRWETAVPLLVQLSQQNPMQGLRAALLARQQGMETQAVQFAENTLRELTSRWDEEPTNIALGVAVAQCQLFLNRHADTVRTLEKALTRTNKAEEQQGLRNSIGDAIVAWITYRNQNSGKESVDQLQTLRMLQYALQYAPSNPRVMTLVTDQVLATFDEDDQQIAAVRNSLIKGSSPGIAHFIQGTSALMKDDLEKGTMHLELAAKLMPHSGAILNNLAVALATRENPDLEHALTIAETAIKQTPDATPHFFETRGQILVKMKRYTDAIADLEKALTVESLAKNVHESLAICYDAINEPEIAQLHREAMAQE